jgi:hypothetical protein
LPVKVTSPLANGCDGGRSLPANVSLNRQQNRGCGRPDKAMVSAIRASSSAASSARYVTEKHGEGPEVEVARAGRPGGASGLVSPTLHGMGEYAGRSGLTVPLRLFYNYPISCRLVTICVPSRTAPTLPRVALPSPRRFSAQNLHGLQLFEIGYRSHRSGTSAPCRPFAWGGPESP